MLLFYGYLQIICEGVTTTIHNICACMTHRCLVVTIKIVIVIVWYHTSLMQACVTPSHAGFLVTNCKILVVR